MTVARILRQKGSSDVATIAPTRSVAEAAALLSEKRIGALVVSGDGSSVEGILSERDVVRWLGREGADCLRRVVADVMTAKVMSCTPADEVQEIMSRMTEGRFRHMPVLEDGRLAGVVSIGDVVKYRMSQLEHETEALADMIKGY
ncbi:CBS domain-containing protein [Albimonas sp. CAU 1670]|uniref:CBS domain-containing protein n=1 Tax=Albimonas sp. CAU 1670 TaxID=3032599 RepID=UPI0023D9B4EE|nr:CBS domain-containing protein [Albimonas sp. CAU 1670]MDF2232232.1 CBS domain-containing protein [Albimonas sp. CAU 1670]